MSNFYVGQKVVCIATLNPAEWGGDFKFNLPQLNTVYTIRQIVLQEYIIQGKTFEQLEAIYLFEVANYPHMFYNTTGIVTYEIAFPAEYFRPLNEKKTDISIFQQMLLPTDVDVSP